MDALTFQGKCAVAFQRVPTPQLKEPTDAIVCIELCGLCGSDLHPYHCREQGLDAGTVMGHEFVGRVVQAGEMCEASGQNYARGRRGGCHGLAGGACVNASNQPPKPTNRPAAPPVCFRRRCAALPARRPGDEPLHRLLRRLLLLPPRPNRTVRLPAPAALHAASLTLLATLKAVPKAHPPYHSPLPACLSLPTLLPAHPASRRCERSQLFGWVEGGAGLHGAQAQYVRVPMADGTLAHLPADVSDEEGLLLGDIFSTGKPSCSRGGRGWHASAAGQIF